MIHHRRPWLLLALACLGGCASTGKDDQDSASAELKKVLMQVLRGVNEGVEIGAAKKREQALAAREQQIKQSMAPFESNATAQAKAAQLNATRRELAAQKQHTEALVERSRSGAGIERFEREFAQAQASRRIGQATPDARTCESDGQAGGDYNLGTGSRIHRARVVNMCRQVRLKLYSCTFKGPRVRNATAPADDCLPAPHAEVGYMGQAQLSYYSERPSEIVAWVLCPVGARPSLPQTSVRWLPDVAHRPTSECVWER